jgi:arylsulfatase A-like enzyme
MDTIALGGRGTEVSAAALAWLDTVATGDRPFYLQLGYHEPHRVGGAEHDESDYMGFIGDYLAPDAARGVTIPAFLRDTPSAREELAELQGAVRALDAAVGTVLRGLDDRGIADDTIVLFTTDHGIALPRAKCSLYDPGLETALIVRYPARGWQGGREITGLTSNIDLFPTLLAAIGLPVSARIQGRSLLAALDGQPFTPREAIFGEMTYHDYYDPRRCIRTAQHKLIVNFTAAPAFMDPSQSWRRRTAPIVPPAPALAYHPLLELYDLAADPHEWRNLAADPAAADLRRDLLARLQRWMAETADPLLHGAVTPPLHRQALTALSEASV